MTDEIFGIVLLCPKHKVLWCIQWILINKDDKDVEDTILIDREMQSIGIKVDKAQARGQEIGANPEKLMKNLKTVKNSQDRGSVLKDVL
ncbi:MAG: hypothetical protein J0I93_11335 [Legionella sp.]|nr:hypothetical protein [Legionella sp.]